MDLYNPHKDSDWLSGWFDHKIYGTVSGYGCRFLSRSYRFVLVYRMIKSESVRITVHLWSEPVSIAPVVPLKNSGIGGVSYKIWDHDSNSSGVLNYWLIICLWIFYLQDFNIHDPGHSNNFSLVNNTEQIVPLLFWTIWHNCSIIDQ